MGSGRCSLVVLLAVALGNPKAQAIQLVNASCETYTRIAVSCVPPVEVDHVSPANFVVWADSSNPEVHCGYTSMVNTMAEQITTILTDSVYVHELSYSDRRGPDAQSSLARSDAAITFRVEANRNCTYHITGTLWTENPTANGIDGDAKASFALTRIDSGVPSVIATWAVQAGPGPPTQHWRGLVYRGELGPGDYVLEGHASAENPLGEGTTLGQVWMEVTFKDAPTAVSPRSWSALKALYR